MFQGEGLMGRNPNRLDSDLDKLAGYSDTV